MDWKYLANNSKLNMVAMANLGEAGDPPTNVRIDRDQGYDTTITWKGNPGGRYTVYWRETSSPVWQGSVRLGSVETYTAKKLSKGRLYLCDWRGGRDSCGSEVAVAARQFGLVVFRALAVYVFLSSLTQFNYLVVMYTGMQGAPEGFDFQSSQKAAATALWIAQILISAFLWTNAEKVRWQGCRRPTNFEIRQLGGATSVHRHWIDCLRLCDRQPCRRSGASDSPRPHPKRPDPGR